MDQITPGHIAHAAKRHAAHVASTAAGCGVKFAAGVRTAMTTTTLGGITLRVGDHDPLVTTEPYDQCGLGAFFSPHIALKQRNPG